MICSLFYSSFVGGPVRSAKLEHLGQIVSREPVSCCGSFTCAGYVGLLYSGWPLLQVQRVISIGCVGAHLVCYGSRFDINGIGLYYHLHTSTYGRVPSDSYVYGSMLRIEFRIRILGYLVELNRYLSWASSNLWPAEPISHQSPESPTEQTLQSPTQSRCFRAANFSCQSTQYLSSPGFRPRLRVGRAAPHHQSHLGLGHHTNDSTIF